MKTKNTQKSSRKYLLVAAGLILIVLICLGFAVIIPKLGKGAPTPVPTTLTPTPVDYSGTYKGNTGVAGGLADVTLSVSGTKMTGTATYKGIVRGYSYTLPATISGTVSPSGVVAGTIDVVGNQHGIAISLSGPTDGRIQESIMNCSYSVSGDAGSYSGQISLTK
jgi:hypothetical protein